MTISGDHRRVAAELAADALYECKNAEQERRLVGRRRAKLPEVVALADDPNTWKTLLRAARAMIGGGIGALALGAALIGSGGPGLGVFLALGGAAAIGLGGKSHQRASTGIETTRGKPTRRQVREATEDVERNAERLRAAALHLRTVYFWVLSGGFGVEAPTSKVIQGPTPFQAVGFHEVSLDDPSPSPRGSELARSKPTPAGRTDFLAQAERALAPLIEDAVRETPEGRASQRAYALGTGSPRPALDAAPVHRAVEAGQASEEHPADSARVGNLDRSAPRRGPRGMGRGPSF